MVCPITYGDHSEHICIAQNKNPPAVDSSEANS